MAFFPCVGSQCTAKINLENLEILERMCGSSDTHTHVSFFVFFLCVCRASTRKINQAEILEFTKGETVCVGKVIHFES